jgi:hypothetical protein
MVSTTTFIHLYHDDVAVMRVNPPRGDNTTPTFDIDFGAHPCHVTVFLSPAQLKQLGEAIETAIKADPQYFEVSKNAGRVS